MAHYSDTICAPASGSGGAVALIRVSGPSALAAADAVVAFRNGTASSAKGYSLKFGSIEGVDDVLVSIFRAPHSYTGEDSAEITCHASSYIVSRILDLLVAAGCRLAGPGEFTQRAFVGGKMDLAQAEAVADVIASSSAVEHRVAMNQMRGGYSAELRGIRDEMMQLAALLELELDFSEEEVEFADRERLMALCNSARKHCSRLSDSFRLGNAVKNGVPVAIVGAPNSGKSTLLNALLGDDRAIVSDIPGTTRDTIEEVCVLDGVKFRFIDTAGLRDASDKVEKMGIDRSYAALEKAQIVLGVIDGSAPSAAADEACLVSLCSSRAPACQLIVIHNKSDLCKKGCLSDSGADSGLLHPVALSALKGDGMDELRALLVSAAGPLDGSETLVTNARHASALSTASASLTLVEDGLRSGLPGDLVAEDLRAAIGSLNEILGEDITANDVLGEIFGRFCIGK